MAVWPLESLIPLEEEDKPSNIPGDPKGYLLVLIKNAHNGPPALVPVHVAGPVCMYVYKPQLTASSHRDEHVSRLVLRWVCSVVVCACVARDVRCTPI